MRVDLRKTVETIRWSDEPGSKEYELDFTDDGLEEIQASMKRAKEALEGISEDRQGAALAVREFVTSIAGQECYDDALAYVDVKGLGADHCVAALAPLVVALADVVTEHIESLKAERIEHYMRLGNAQADLV